MSSPLVSIITPVFNRKDMIADCIRSVQEQTYKNYEHIIIDDGSNDGTLEFVKGISEEDKKIILIEAKDHSMGKIGKVRNLGIKNSHGEYLAFIDSDDLWRENKLEVQMQYMLQGNFSFSYHPLGKFKQNLDDQNGYWGRLCDKQDIFRGLFLENFIPTCSVIAKRHVIENAKLFNETLPYSEDHLLWLTIALRENSFGFLTSILGGFRRNKHGNVNSILERNEKTQNEISLKELLLSEYGAESIPRLTKKDLLYEYIFYYFDLARNELDTEKRKLLLSKAMDKIFQLNLSKLFMKELDLLRNIRKI